MNTETMEWAIRAAGLGLFAICAAMTHFPKAMGLKRQLAGLSPLTRQLVVMQSGYTLAFVLLVGLLSVAAPRMLLDATPLATCVSAYLFAFWGSRVVLQLAYVDKSDKPAGPKYKVAEWGFLCLFVYVAATFGWALAHNVQGMA